MFTWITGGLLLAWLVCPLAAIIIVSETNRWLRRRTARANLRRRLAHLQAPTTGELNRGIVVDLDAFRDDA